MATLVNPFIRGLDANGDAASGALLYVFEAGTTTPVTTYSDSSLTTAQAHPLVANAAGEFEQVFLAAGTYKIRVSGSDAVTLYENDSVRMADRPDDPVFLSDIDALFSDTTSYVEGQEINTKTERFAATIAASGATDNNATRSDGTKLYIQPASVGIYNAKSFGAKGDNSTDDGPALQAAINAAEGSSLHIPAGIYLTGQDLLIPAETIIQGAGRRITEIKGLSGVSNAILYKTTGNSTGVCIRDIRVNANNLANYCIEIEENGYGEFSGLDCINPNVACFVAGPATNSGETFNSNTIRACNFTAGNAAAYSLHLRAGAVDNFFYGTNASNATTACVQIEAGGNKFTDVRTFGGSNPPTGFYIDGTDTALVHCRAGNIGSIAFDVRRSNTQIIEAEVRWDSAVAGAYPVSVATGIKGLRLSGYSRGGADVEQVQFADASPDRSNMVFFSSSVGSAADPSTPSFLVFGEPLKEIHAGSFDTTLGGNSSDTSADSGLFYSTGTGLSIASHQITPITLNRTGNNGPAITLVRSGTTIGFLNITTGKIELDSNGSIELNTSDDLIFTGLATSSVGLPAGAVWNDSGTLKIV